MPDAPVPPGLDRQAVADRSVLLIIDLQTAFNGKLHDETSTVEANVRLLRAASILGIPVVVTEHYPKGLGTTREEIEDAVPSDAARFEKRTFSCMGGDGFAEHLRELGRDQVIVGGIETHICVSQTIHDLHAAGYQVHAIRDAISSRFPREADVGFAKLTGSGAVPSTVECVLFEWVRDSRSPHFKKIQQLVV